MADDARQVRNTGIEKQLAATTVTAYELWQTPTGRAGVLDSPVSKASGDYFDQRTDGQWTATKTTGFSGLKGGRAYWDYSANAVYYKKSNDRDFYIGRFAEDAASATNACVIDLNADPAYDIDFLRDGFLSVPTGTLAFGGFGLPKVYGGARLFELTATNEAQCIDYLSVDRFAVGANAIAEFILRIPTNGTTSAVDFNIGIGNGTSTTDADAVTEHVLFHIDGASTAINAQSKDTSTTVAATDTTTTFTAGSAVANRVELWIDTRDVTSTVIYVNGSRVLSGTTFPLTAATGPLGLLIHLEKTSSTATGQFIIEAARARYAEQ
jgi:hypothetical protein